MYNRSFHFIPGHKKKFIENIPKLKSDHIIFDLEDGVPFDQKNEARNNIYKICDSNKDKNYWVRIHDHDSDQFERDVDYVNEIENISVVIPKFNPDVDYHSLNQKKKIIIIEDLKALNTLTTNNESVKMLNLFGAGLGLEDMFIDFFQDNNELIELTDFLKLQFIICFKPVTSILIDSVSVNYTDMGLFKNNCEKSLSKGFTSCFSIHPNQLEVINEIYVPKENSLMKAKKLLEISKENESLGYGVIGGVLVSPPKIKKAKTILKWGGINE